MSGYEMGQRVAAVLSGAAVAPFTYDEVDNGGATYFQFPAVIPTTQHFLGFCQFRVDVDHRGFLLNLEEASASDGWRSDDNSSDGFANPEVDFPIVGTTDGRYISAADFAIGDLMNMLVSGSISGSVATSRVVIWDSTSATATTEFNETSAASATAYDWDRYSPLIPGLLAGSDGSREHDGKISRFAWWDDGDLGGPPPDITAGAVQDNFFNSTTGALINPTVSQGAYGVPLYDIYGPKADWDAGTNKGSGGNFTRVGPVFTV